MENLLKLPASLRGTPNTQPSRGAFSVRVVDAPTSEPAVALTVDQAARQIGCSELEVLRMIARGVLKAQVVADRWRILPDQLAAAMANGMADWRLPADLLQSDYATEKKMRAAWLEAAAAATPTEAVLAKMKQQVKPGGRLEDVAEVAFVFNSAPADFAARLSQPASSGEFRTRIRGHQEPAERPLAQAWVRARLNAVAQKSMERDNPLALGLVGLLYSSPTEYRRLTQAFADEVLTETLFARETRVVQVKTREVEHGGTVEVVYSKIPVSVTYSIGVANLDSILRVRQQIQPTF